MTTDMPARPRTAPPVPDASRTAPRAAASNEPNAFLRFAGRIRAYFPSLDHDTASYYLIMISTLSLVLLGLVMVLSASAVESIRQGQASYGVFLRQAMWAVGGLVVMWVASRTKVRTLRRAAPKLLLLAILALVAVQIFGYEVNGNKNWIQVGPLSGQPSEFAKLALVLWMPWVLTRKDVDLTDWRHLLYKVMPLPVVVMALIMAGRDMGTAVLVLLIITAAVYTAGVPMRILLGAGGIMAAAALALVLTSSNRMGRLATWISGHGCEDYFGACWQSQSGIYGLATGGWLGMGLGSSREKWSWLPEAHNDYIFAILGEELGFVGTMAVLLLFTLMGFAFLRVVARHQDPFIRIATGCVLIWVLGQALTNTGMVMGLLPVIGVPLPLISAGGTALVFTLAAIGVVQSFARTEPKPEPLKDPVKAGKP